MPAEQFVAGVLLAFTCIIIYEIIVIVKDNWKK